MQTFRKLILSTLISLSYVTGFAQSGRIEKNIDFDWYFHLGDMANGETAPMQDTAWRKLDLPHDWSIEGNYSEHHPGGSRMGFLPGGIGWYRKILSWDAAWKDKQVSVEFDGVYMNSTVWINGHLLGNRPYGYIGFSYDLTPYLRKGENVIAVRVDHSKGPTGRWYTGSGIYRHVHLLITDKIHVTRYGSLVQTPEVSKAAAAIHTETAIENESGRNTEVTVISVIRDKRGKEVARKSRKAVLNSAVTTRITEDFTISKPALWSPETPDVYYLETMIKHNDKLLDSYSARFGIRSIEISADTGFKLNGNSIKFKGVCNHQDAGPVGVAVPEDVLYSRMKLLKAMGVNAIRTAHHPFAPEFYAMCDTMGFMVMDEAFDGWKQPKAKWDYGNFWDAWWRKDLEDFVKRDRNYPCIMIWSMGNEVKPNPEGQMYDTLQKEIYDAFRALDTTRPITQAYARGKYLDIAGFNGDGEDKVVMPGFHKDHPEVPIIGTEMLHTRQTRGVYRTKTSYHRWDKPIFWERTAASKKEYLSKCYPIPDLTEKEVFTDVDPRYASSYDNQTIKLSVRDAWIKSQNFDYFMGDFRWTGFDYIGESWDWPARTNNYGVIDLAGFPKDHFYLYQSFWTNKPMVHLLPHWTHPGKEGVKIPVVAYTNGDAVELFLNGRSLGKKIMYRDTLQIVWQVPYQPGTLVAVAYKEGRIIARDTVITAGSASSMRLLPDRKTMRANRRDVVQVEVDITDAAGHFVPAACDTVHFEVTGPYKLLGVENGDILDVSPQKVLWRKAFMGKALLMLQATGKAGVIHVRATARGLKPAEVLVVVR